MVHEVGQDPALLVLDHRAHGVLEGLFVVDHLEGFEDVPAFQLLGEPARSGVGAHHGGGQQGQRLRG